MDRTKNGAVDLGKARGRQMLVFVVLGFSIWFMLSVASSVVISRVGLSGRGYLYVSEVVSLPISMMIAYVMMEKRRSWHPLFSLAAKMPAEVIQWCRLNYSDWEVLDARPSRKDEVEIRARGYLGPMRVKVQPGSTVYIYGRKTEIDRSLRRFLERHLYLERMRRDEGLRQ